MLTKPWPRPFGEMTFEEKMAHLDKQVEIQIVAEVEGTLLMAGTKIGVDAGFKKDSTMLTIIDHLPGIDGMQKMKDDEADRIYQMMKALVLKSSEG